MPEDVQCETVVSELGYRWLIKNPPDLSVAAEEMQKVVREGTPETAGMTVAAWGGYADALRRFVTTSEQTLRDPIGSTIMSGWVSGEGGE